MDQESVAAILSSKYVTVRRGDVRFPSVCHGCLSTEIDTEVPLRSETSKRVSFGTETETLTFKAPYCRSCGQPANSRDVRNRVIQWTIIGLSVAIGLYYHLHPLLMGLLCILIILVVGAFTSHTEAISISRHDANTITFWIENSAYMERFRDANAAVLVKAKS